MLSSVIAIFSVLFITFFFLKEEGLFYAMVTSVFPEHYHGNITRALDSVTVLLARYFTGILSESLLLTIAVTLVMMAFGMKAADAGFIGLIMGVMNVVPYAGPLIGGVVSVFVGICLADRGHERGAYGFRDRRVAADPQGHGRFHPPADALFRTSEGASARKSSW